MHLEIPRIINTIQDMRERLVGEGSLTFTCQFEGSPLPNITFYFNGAITTLDSGVSIINNTLTIPSPQVSHSGIYQCIVSNEFGDDQIAWLLEIRHPSEYLALILMLFLVLKSFICVIFSFTTSEAIEPYRAWCT